MFYSHCLKEAGFSFVELNASDTRNAKSLKEIVTQTVGNTSMVNFTVAAKVWSDPESIKPRPLFSHVYYSF